MSRWHTGRKDCVYVISVVCLIRIRGNMQPRKLEMAGNKRWSEVVFLSYVCILLFIIFVYNAFIVNLLQLLSNT
jgi:hypothetical protein